MYVLLCSELSQKSSARCSRFSFTIFFVDIYVGALSSPYTFQLSCVVFSEKLRQQLIEATSIIITSLNSQLLKKIIA